MDDDERDRFAIGEFEAPSIEPLWITKDGRELYIRNMETSHIDNTIKMLERNIEEDKDLDASSTVRNYAHMVKLSRLFKIAEFKTELDRRDNDKG